MIVNISLLLLQKVNFFFLKKEISFERRKLKSKEIINLMQFFVVILNIGFCSQLKF